MCVQIDVGYNSFNQAASLELIAAMKGKNMKSIGMADCKLGVVGAKAVAELVTGSVMTSVRSPAAHRTPPICSPFSLN